MEKLNIICVDDQRQVVTAILKDLQSLCHVFNIEDCESVDEALALIDELDAQGQHIALVISDQVMPGKTGVEFLTELDNDYRFPHTKKILLTGQATQQDTIDAINKAHIQGYFEKPWDSEQLLVTTRKLVTQYIFDAGIDHTQISNEYLDNTILLERLRTKNLGH